MEDFIYKNDYQSNELLIKRMKENVEYAIRRLESHLEHNYPMNYVDQLAIEEIRKQTTYINQELGCPSSVYIKAVRNGYIYTNVELINDYVEIEVLSVDDKTFFAKKGTNIFIKCEDYGKTWWLKEDKSE